jgi:ribose 5-phosphate isomerase A
MNVDGVKRAIGEYAARMVPKKGLIGLGSGTTSQEFIKALGRSYDRQAGDLQCVATSLESELLAKINGLILVEQNQWTDGVDIAFDGADAIDEEGTALKGAGGALLREKIVMAASKRRVLMIDERKWRKPWKECALHVAIVPFGAAVTCASMDRLGVPGTIRMRGSAPFLTNDGHYIVDVPFPSIALSLKELDIALKQIPGVVETGIFFHIASEIVIGYGDGHIEHKVVQA